MRKLNELGLKSTITKGKLDKKSGVKQPDGPLYSLWCILKGAGYCGLGNEDWSAITIQILREEISKLKTILR